MASKAVVSLSTGMEDAEKVTVAFLVAVGVACDGCPPLPELFKRYEAAGGTYYACPVCFNARQLDADQLIAGAELQGTIPMWNWIGDEAATTFSY
jgi:predicted peroxiredoxin